MVLVLLPLVTQWQLPSCGDVEAEATPSASVLNAGMGLVAVRGPSAAVQRPPCSCAYGSVMERGSGGDPQASELREVRVGLGGRRAAALCSVRKL